MNSHSQFITIASGAKVETATVSVEGRDYTAGGAVLGEARGLIVAYISGIPGHYNLTTWGGDVLGPATLVSTYYNKNVFGGFPVRMWAWRATVNGRVYSGRNAGPQMLLRMRRKNKCRQCGDTGYIQHGSANDLPMSTTKC